MAMKGGGFTPSTKVFWIKGSFHRAVLEAAGDTLCPFKRTKDDSFVSGPSIVSVEPSMLGGGCDVSFLERHCMLGVLALLQASLVGRLVQPFALAGVIPALSLFLFSVHLFAPVSQL